MKDFTRNKLVVTLLAIVMCSGVFAQTNVDSPYSIFGLGQVRDKTMNARLRGMGGVSNAMFGKTVINAENPASYAMIDTLAFLFDAGMYAKSSSFSTSSMTESARTASLDYVAMGFGITNWWKMSIGAQPYSNVGYNIVTPGYNELNGSYNQIFFGDGGLNQVYIGNAFRIGKHFAVGANATYVFGNTKSMTTLTYPDSTFVICSRRSRDIMISSFMFDYGVMYHGNISDDMVLSVGVTYDQHVNLKGEQTVFLRSIEATSGQASEVEYVLDTIFYKHDHNATFSMPQGFGFGVALQKNNRWTLGADFNWAQWERFERNGVNESLQNSWSVALGGEYKPVSTSVSSYWSKMSYRLGGFYEQTYLNVDGHSINKIGVTAGMTLPIPKSLSKINLGLEVGQCGTKSANLIQERYVNLTVGVSIFERWFMKRKYK